MGKIASRARAEGKGGRLLGRKAKIPSRPVRLRGTENRHKAIQKSRAEVRNSQTNLSYAKSAGMRKS